MYFSTMLNEALICNVMLIAYVVERKVCYIIQNFLLTIAMISVHTK